jgi:hypothetical protein
MFWLSDKFEFIQNQPLLYEIKTKVKYSIHLISHLFRTKKTMGMSQIYSFIQCSMLTLVSNRP